MRKSMILLLLLALMVGLAACDNDDDVVIGGIITGALHRVEYGGNVVYLFGTYHSSRTEWFPLSEVVEDALRNSDVLLLEIEELGLGSSGHMAIQQAFRSMQYLPTGLTWSEYLPEDAYNHLVEVLDTWDVRYENVRSVHPLLLVIDLENWLEFSLADLNDTFFDIVDVYIAGRARELDLPIIGLESLEQEIDMFYNPPFEVMLARIMKFKPLEESTEAFSNWPTLNDYATYYENNDFDSLLSIIAHEAGSRNECLYITYYRDIVFNLRSENFANEIIRLLQETKEPTTFFVAVGLSHIIRSGAGEEFTDIVQQLRLAGFTVTPIWQ